MAILSVLANIAKAVASTGKQMAAVGKKTITSIAKVTQKSIDILFNNTTMFLIIFGYVISTAITGGESLWKTSLITATVGGGILGLTWFFGSVWVALSAGLYIAYKVIVRPYAVIYQNIISVTRLEHIVPDKYVPMAQRIGTLEPYISLVSNIAFLFFIIAIFKHDKQWIHRAGKVLVLLILFGLAANVDLFLYPILFSFKDFITMLFRGG